MPCPAGPPGKRQGRSRSRGRGTEGKAGSRGWAVVFTGKNGLGIGELESCQWTPACAPEQVVVWSLALG